MSVARHRTILAWWIVLGATACYEGDPNAPAPPDFENPPIVTGVTPPSASPGDVVTITGDNFGTDPSVVTVTFGSVHEGQVVFLATTNMDVRIPAGASGLLQIVVVVAGVAAIGPSIVVT